jgi:hypothetical protein
MAKKTQELSIREQAAIRLYLYENEDLSPVYVYRLAHPGSLEDWDKLKDPAASASRWIRTEKVVQYMTEQRAILNDRKSKERMKIESEVTARLQASRDTSDHKIPGFVDYSQPKAQLAKLNELINTASDPGEVLDAMKVLLSKQAELAPARKESPQVRAYLPLRCSDCHLYRLIGEVQQHHPDLQARLREISNELKENNP